MLSLVAVSSASFVPSAAQVTPAAGEPPFRIGYRLAMTRPESHLFEVQIEVEGLASTRSLDFQMPRWSPGRYAVFDFAKNVQEFAASSICEPQPACLPRPLAVTRTDTQTWRVETGGLERVRASYKVFADDLSGTFSQLDARHANYNGASVFMYVAGHKQDAVRLTIDAPRGWRIVNGYTEREGQRAWEFANYDLLIDTPTEIARDWTADEFRVEGKTYRVVVHSFGAEGGRRGALVRDIEKIVRAQTAMMGAPEFDSYTFLIHFDPTASGGDGMEHLTSTQIISAGTLADPGRYEAVLGTASHEFFHVWNMKRLRPVGLGPWDFTRPVVTRGLWIGEGFTNYYGPLMLRRAGLLSEREYLDDVSGNITFVENAPGSRLMSAEESSLLAPFIDGPAHKQRVNLQNTAISYYPKGEALALTLDLLIRGKTRGRASLDEVMRRMYEEFYLRSAKDSYYLRGRAYTNEDFFRVVSQVAGEEMSEFFRRYVRGTETPPYEEALAHVGLRLVRGVNEREPFNAGLRTDDGVVNVVRPDSAAARAGLRQGDVLVSIGNANVTGETWRDTLNTFKQGARVPFKVRRASQTVNADIILDAPDNFTYRVEEIKDAPKEARALRAAWLAKS
ncbi:MAG TPA: PDZ domain-containing protein [Pyrinomonadaceae bacterium]|nr:PDZ domain-containing protein [Pyrinomonadaceae bacterium]